MRFCHTGKDNSGGNKMNLEDLRKNAVTLCDFAMRAGIIPGVIK